MATPTPDNYPGTPGTLLYGGMATPAAGTLLTTLTLVNTSGSEQAAGFVSPMFGQPFKQGDIPAGEYPAFTLTDDTPVPATIHSVTSWPDGSMKWCGVTLQVGQEMFMCVKASAAITNGQCVMVTGTDGNSGRIKAAPANGDGSINAMFVIGVATQDIALNDEGFVTAFGLVRSLDTDGSVVGETWVDGDVLYPHPTIVGGLTKGSHVLDLPIAFVLRAANNGSLFVRR